jgi:3-phosphoshikimate 1-carboxyvinyltransferase
MRIRVTPGALVGGGARVPGDKSIAHRWLLLASIANGRSQLSGLPPALDVASTARACAALLSDAGDLPGWVRSVESGDVEPLGARVRVAGAGLAELRTPATTLDCGNSGTSMRLLAGVLAGSTIEAVLDGDGSLRVRPMERVAEPLRRMGAGVETHDGHAPLSVKGAELHGIRYEPPVPSAQVKSAVLLAGIAADGATEVVEAVGTRDHTERVLRALGAPMAEIDSGVRVERFDVPGFDGTVPGDVSSIAFLAGAALVTGGAVELERVGCNPTRTRFLDVLARMGGEVEIATDRDELGEPIGSIRVGSGSGLRGTVVEAGELPGVVDEVPLLAAVAVHARGETRFEGAGELRVKESDRLTGVRDMVRRLGGEASIDGDALVIGGGGLHGGTADSNGDHRMAMAAVVAAVAADGPCEVEGAEAAAVSFPGFTVTMLDLGARIEVLG